MDNSKPDITLVTLTPDHFAAILKIEKAVYKDPWSAASFLEIMSFSPNNWVAMVDGHVVGYIITQWVIDEIHILNVAVAEEMHRKGVGSKLLSYLVAEGQKQGMRDMFLEVRVTNTPAQALYERFGFKPLSVRKKYYGDGEDALVMHCAMPEIAAPVTDEVMAGETGSKTEEK
ncbi:MAG TPA: ribosomal protein S18-alanine N-acetyltransferase [bacterium]|jgi:ribosomal-protein-alanine N-acetyltransferase